MQKWEYCVITGVVINTNGVLTGRNPRLYHFSLDGIDKKEYLGDNAANARPRGWKDVNETGYIAHTVAMLGSEGWEMVGTGMGNEIEGIMAHCIYFRRPIEDRHPFEQKYQINEIQKQDCG